MNSLAMLAAVAVMAALPTGNADLIPYRLARHTRDVCPAANPDRLGGYERCFQKEVKR